jgi:hypothetical protein
MKIRCLTLFLLLMMLSQDSAFSQKPDLYIEKYHYEAVPTGREDETEQIDLSLSFEADSIIFASTAVSEKGEKRIQVKMTGEGDLISGVRSFTDRSGRVTEEKIWRDDNKAYIEQTVGRDRKTIALDIPEGATLAVEGSLLVLLRFFPYKTAARWNLFMIDFSGKSVAATARQTGIERIEVPAGEFACYRVEVLFRVRIVSPKVVCWVTTEKPHVVVKSVGKRGLFTAKYVTSLIGRQLLESMAQANR